jgi:hypothetical protein
LNFEFGIWKFLICSQITIKKKHTQRILYFIFSADRDDPAGTAAQGAFETVRRAYDSAVRDTAHMDPQCEVLRHRAAAEATVFRHPVRFLEACETVLERCGYQWDLVAELQALAMSMLSGPAWAAWLRGGTVPFFSLSLNFCSPFSPLSALSHPFLSDTGDDASIVTRVRHTLARASGLCGDDAITAVSVRGDADVAATVAAVRRFEVDPASAGTDAASAVYSGQRWIVFERAHGTAVSLAVAEAASEALAEMAAAEAGRQGLAMAAAASGESA